jgi:hypothetical protein
MVVREDAVRPAGEAMLLRLSYIGHEFMVRRTGLVATAAASVLIVLEVLG